MIIMVALDRQVEIDILKVLSDFTPRNQNEIARAIGRSDKKSTDRVKVHRAIHRSVKYYTRSLPGLDDNGKFWVLKKDLETVGQVVTDYPEFLSHFQSQDIVLSMLIDKHVNQVCPGEKLSDEQVMDFKHRLKMSTTLFCRYLFGDPDELRNIINKLFRITRRGQELEPAQKLNSTVNSNTPFNEVLDVLFKSCVDADIMYGKECSAGIEFLEHGVKW